MPTFGLRPDDFVRDSRGDIQIDLKQTFYATRADAEAQTNPLGTATSGKDGKWQFASSASGVFGRDPEGNIRFYDSEEPKLTEGFAPQVPPPAGFAFSSLALPTVRRTGGGRFLADPNIEPMRPAAGVTYYVAPTGVDTNTGLTAASPITIPGALAKADAGTIVYAPGEYFRNTHTTAQTSKSINHLAAGPGVKVTGWNSPSSTTWTLTSGNIYQTSRSSTAQVVDVNNRTARGDYTVYEKVADLASITKAGQWAIVGSTVYVWAIGNTNLTDINVGRWQIRLGLSATYTGLNLTGGTSYVRGIDFEGQSYGTAVAGGALLIAEDCTFRYSLVDGVPVSGSKFVGVRCTASSNATDGFSYADGNSIACNFIEVYCRAYNNGALAGSSTNNATTSHGTSRGLRVGGSYFEAGGPTVADVNSARTWNLGCYAGGNTAPDAQNHSWRTDAVGFESTPAEMWLDECTSDTATYGYKVTGGSKIHLHATSPGNKAAYDTSGSGVIDYYATA